MLRNLVFESSLSVTCDSATLGIFLSRVFRTHEAEEAYINA